MKMLDGHHQIPFLVHRNRVGEGLVEDLDQQQRGDEEGLKSGEDDEGGVANHQERGRGGKQLGQLAARVGAGEVICNADVDRERVDIELHG